MSACSAAPEFIDAPPYSTEPTTAPSTVSPEPTTDPLTPTTGIYYVLILHV